MTKRRLLWQLASVVLLLVGFLWYSYSEYNEHNHASNTFVGYHATLIALIFASYLAYAFQQRSKIADDLRKWWSEIIIAKSEFFIYLDKSNPNEDDYLKGFYKMSTAMDNLRLIYCNVNRSRTDDKGLFPFEQVRDIIEIAKSVSPNENPSKLDRIRAKHTIIEVFGSLRHSIQSEAGAVTPDRPVVLGCRERGRYKAKIIKELEVDLDVIRNRNLARENLQISGKGTV